MILDYTSPNIWNDWRENYYNLSSKEHLEFYNWLEEHYPSQKHFTHNHFDELFKDLSLPRVLEIGGWKGELAQYSIGRFNIASWINVEICMNAIHKQCFKHPKYYVYYPADFWWYKNPHAGPQTKADVLIASHMIEHLSDMDFLEFAKFSSKYQVVAFEAPINEDGSNDWTNDVSTHILTYSFKQVDEIMKSHGFRVDFSKTYFRIYKR